MIIFLQIIAKTVSIALSFIMYAMMARALLPLFVNPMESRVYYFVYAITEPVVIPFRWIFYKLNIGQNSPFDISFFFAYIALMFTNAILPVI